jgi:exodeoxyribonuclease VII large subunit
LVQGDGAKEQISQAIAELNAYYPGLDVMIVGRGGGSIEDLWAFNEEIVARAIYDSRIPVISAVGHEYDVTIADFVADLRAATPSNAAELVVREKQALVERVQNARQKLITYFSHVVENFRMRVNYAVNSPVLTRPRERLEEIQQHIDELLERIAVKSGHVFEIYRSKFKDMENMLFIRFEHYFETKKTGMSYLAGQLNAFSPLGVLERGYSIVYAQPGDRIINKSSQVKIGGEIRVKLSQGEITGTVKDTKES